MCESLPPRPAGRLHAQEASHTLGSGWPKASPPTSPRGGSHRQIRERQRAGARPRHGQVLPEPRSDKIRTGGQMNRNPHQMGASAVRLPRPAALTPLASLASARNCIAGFAQRPAPVARGSPVGSDHRAPRSAPRLGASASPNNRRGARSRTPQICAAAPGHPAGRRWTLRAAAPASGRSGLIHTASPNRAPNRLATLGGDVRRTPADPANDGPGFADVLDRIDRPSGSARASAFRRQAVPQNTAGTGPRHAESRYRHCVSDVPLDCQCPEFPNRFPIQNSERRRKRETPLSC